MGNIFAISTLKVSYDDKFNPHFKLGGFWDIFRYFSKNNFTELYRVQADGSINITNNHYEFDTDGRPIKVFKTSDNKTQLFREYTYY
jgi:hypothetical protein